MSKDRGNQRLIPTIRFKGFTDDWEQRKLSELVTMIDGDRGSNYPHDSDFHSEGETVFLDTGNVRPDGFHLGSRKYISEQKNRQLRSGLLNTGDFVMTTRGTLGNVAYYGDNVQTNFPKVRINSAMLILRPTGRVSNSLLLSLLRGNLISTFLKKDHVGSAQPHITKRDFSKMLVSFPRESAEQNAIGSLLQSLDSTIVLHQRKYENLQAVKKELLKRMFASDKKPVPDFRFNGYTNDWEQRKLMSLLYDIGTGRSSYILHVQSKENPYAVLGSTSILGYDSSFDHEGNFVLTARVGANAGTLFRYSGKAKITDNTVYLKTGNPVFVEALLNHVNVRRLSFGTGQPLIKVSELTRLKVSVPNSMPEINKIQTLFECLDSTIALHQRKLEDLKQLKKVLLQKLFV